MNAFLARVIIAHFAFVSGFAALPAWAHHGTAAVSAIGADGPGAALDTTSPLPLGQGIVFALGKTEYVRFQRRDGFSDQKSTSTFNTVALGFGLTPWLSVFVFQPYNLKSQDGVGSNSGFGDTNLMASLALKWDGGLQFAPEKESLDDLEDWHFGVWASCSVPSGATRHTDDHRKLYAPDMQTGFRGPSPAIGFSVLKQIATDFTAIAEVNHQAFFAQTYTEADYRYQFGAETRLNAALVYRLWASSGGRIDLSSELSMLNLQRDEQDGVALQASGGTILYGQLGVRATFGAFSVGVSMKRAMVKSLNEASAQQGSEGLEDFRAALVLGYAIRWL